MRESMSVCWGGGEDGYGGVGEIDGVYVWVAPGAAVD